MRLQAAIDQRSEELQARVSRSHGLQLTDIVLGLLEVIRLEVSLHLGDLIGDFL